MSEPKCELYNINVQCPKCERNYSDPKLVHCCHVVCRTCIPKWIENSDQEPCCPLCKSTLLPPFPEQDTAQDDCIQQLVDRLPVDVAASTWVEYNAILTENHVCSVCSVDTRATTFCLDCYVKLCTHCCKKKHGRHLQQQLKMLNMKLLMEARISYCDTCSHDQKKAEHYCHDHKEFCCERCFQLDHKMCLNDTKVTATDVMKTLTGQAKLLRRKESDLFSKISQLRDVQKQSNKACREIDNICQEFDKKNSQEIDKQCQEFVKCQEHKDHIQEYAREVGTAINLLKQKRYRLSTTLTTTEWWLKEASDDLVLRKQTELKVFLEHLEQQSQLPADLEEKMSACPINSEFLTNLARTLNVPSSHSASSSLQINGFALKMENLKLQKQLQCARTAAEEDAKVMKEQERNIHQATLQGDELRAHIKTLQSEKSSLHTNIDRVTKQRDAAANKVKEEMLKYKKQTEEFAKYKSEQEKRIQVLNISLTDHQRLDAQNKILQVNLKDLEMRFLNVSKERDAAIAENEEMLKYKEQQDLRIQEFGIKVADLESLLAQNKILQINLKDLEMRFLNVSKERDAAIAVKEEMLKYKEQAEELARINKEREVQILLMREGCDGLITRNEKLLTELKSLQNKIDSARREKEEMMKHKEMYRKTRAQMLNSMKKIVTDIKSTEKKNSLDGCERQTWESRTMEEEDTNKKLQELQSENDKLSQEMSSLVLSISGMFSFDVNFDTLPDKVKAVEKGLEGYRCNFQQKERDCNLLRMRLDAATRKNDEMEKNLKDLRTSKENLQGIIKTVHSTSRSTLSLASSANQNSFMDIFRLIWNCGRQDYKREYELLCSSMTDIFNTIEKDNSKKAGDDVSDTRKRCTLPTTDKPETLGKDLETAMMTATISDLKYQLKRADQKLKQKEEINQQMAAKCKEESKQHQKLIQQLKFERDALENCVEQLKTCITDMTSLDEKDKKDSTYEGLTPFTSEEEPNEYICKDEDVTKNSETKTEIVNEPLVHIEQLNFENDPVEDWNHLQDMYLDEEDKEDVNYKGQTSFISEEEQKKYVCDEDVTKDSETKTEIVNEPEVHKPVGSQLAAVIKVNDRVKRSQEWCHGDQDGSTPGHGTVTEVPTNHWKGYVKVQWDAGGSGWCIMGDSDVYELELV